MTVGLLFNQDALGIIVMVVLCSSIHTKPPQIHAVTVGTGSCVYVSTPVPLATTRTKNPAKHAKYVYQVLTMMKLEKRCANHVYRVHLMMKLEKRCAKNVLVVDIHIQQKLAKQHRAMEQDAVQEHSPLKLVSSHRQNVNLVLEVITVPKKVQLRV